MIDKERFDWGSCDSLFVQMNEEEIFNNKIYELCFAVEEGDIVVDIGASVGPFTYSILHKKPKHCYVVEPMNEQFETLKNNLLGYPVSFHKLAISDKNNLIVAWNGEPTKPRTIPFEQFIEENNLQKIDFLKVDCEGGEYCVFTIENLEFLSTIPKVVCEFHLGTPLLKTYFRNFRDNILPNMCPFEVFSIDGTSIRWDLYNEHFIEYYKEVIFHINKNLKQ